MHPAPSISMFTALSGVGFGLLIWLGLGVPALSGWAAFWAFGLAYGLSVIGLISSTLHLGHPERALKAFSQWRSSWLSREGVVSVAALLVVTVPLWWAGLAALCVHLVGLLASRWLFFAEAEHVVGLYYGKR